MLDPRIIKPLVQSGLSCLRNTPDHIRLEYQNGDYIFYAKQRSGFPWVTTVGIVMMSIFLPIEILIIYYCPDITTTLIISIMPGFFILFASLWLFAGISGELIQHKAQIILTEDRTVKIVMLTGKKGNVYTLPKDEPIQFASQTKGEVIENGRSTNVKTTYTIYNLGKFGITFPFEFDEPGNWFNTLFNEINAAWYGVKNQNVPSAAIPLSQPSSHPYDRKKYDNISIPTPDSAQEIFPVLNNMPSFDDDRYVPVPSEHIALSGRYHNLTKIGSGAQGSMFRALDQNNQPVGIKVYDFQTFQSWKDAELFEREVKTLQSLNFKGIPKYIELIDRNPLYYLVESYIPAPSMAKRIKDGERLSFQNALTVLIHIAEILNYLESLTPPVIHRDIKPDNLLIDDKYNVWLVDFGVVADANQKTNAATFAGTAGYMAPEQLMGKVTPAADIYSAGISILTYLTGKNPTDMKMNGLSIDVKAELPANIPAWFKQLILDMTEPAPAKRISKAASIAAIIRDCLSRSSHNNNNKGYNTPYHAQNQSSRSQYGQR